MIIKLEFQITNKKLKIDMSYSPLILYLVDVAFFFRFSLSHVLHS